MDFSTTIQRIAESPQSHLDAECSLALGAFLFGYRATDVSATPALKQLADKIPGPSEADGCTRGFLEYGGGPTAFRKVLALLQEIVREHPPSPPVAGALAELEFVETVREAIISGSTGIALAEPTIMWLGDHYRGFLAGLESSSPSTAKDAARELREFEAWLQARYGELDVRWDRLIRVFEGAGERGLRRFVELWDEFFK